MSNSSRLVNEAIDRIEVALEAGRDTPPWAFVMIVLLCILLAMCAAHMLMLCLITPTLGAWGMARRFSRVIDSVSVVEDEETPAPKPKKKKKKPKGEDAFDMET